VPISVRKILVEILFRVLSSAFLITLARPFASLLRPRFGSVGSIGPSYLQLIAQSDYLEKPNVFAKIERFLTAPETKKL